jgi:hypothetical protein
MADVGTRFAPCEHDWSYVEVENSTWNRCSKCGFGELWAAGNIMSSTDWRESRRLSTLEGIEVRDAS